MEVLLKLLEKLFLLFEILIFARVVLSFIPLAREHMINQFIFSVTEPLMIPMRWLLKKSIFGKKGQVFDVSPFIAYVVLEILKNTVIAMQLM